MVPIFGVLIITLPPVYLGAIDINRPEALASDLGGVVTMSDGWFMLGTRVICLKGSRAADRNLSLPAR